MFAKFPSIILNLMNVSNKSYNFVFLLNSDKLIVVKIFIIISNGVVMLEKLFIIFSMFSFSYKSVKINK